MGFSTTTQSQNATTQNRAYRKITITTYIECVEKHGIIPPSPVLEAPIHLFARGWSGGPQLLRANCDGEVSFNGPETIYDPLKDQ